MPITQPSLGHPIADLLKSKKEPSQCFIEKPMVHVHEFYLSGEIEQSSTYTEWFNTIRHASPVDVVKIYINSCGGDLWTAIQFIRVIRESKATVIASVEGSCMSAATIIFLTCDQYEISPHSMFMFHNYSGGVGGKGGEMIDQIKHYRDWSENMLKETYKNFLSATEVQAILNNKDIWMTSDEVVKRLNVKGKILKKERAKLKAEQPEADKS